MDYYCQYIDSCERSGCKWWCEWYKPYFDPDKLQECKNFKKA